MEKILQSLKDVNRLSKGQVLSFRSAESEVKFVYLGVTGTSSIDYMPGSELFETIDGLDLDTGRDVHITMQDAGTMSDRGYPSSNSLVATDQSLSEDEIQELKKKNT